MLSLQSFLREGRVVGPCWENFEPKGPKGPRNPQAVSDDMFQLFPNDTAGIPPEVPPTTSTPSTLNPTPSTLNTKPSTLHLNPTPHSLNLPPSTLNPQPQTLNPKPYTLTPNPSTQKVDNKRKPLFVEDIRFTTSTIQQVSPAPFTLHLQPSS